MYIANSRATTKNSKRENGIIKLSIKTTKGKKSVKDKNRNKEQIENSNKYGRY